MKPALACDQSFLAKSTSKWKTDKQRAWYEVLVAFPYSPKLFGLVGFGGLEELDGKGFLWHRYCSLSHTDMP